jgi:hypothetical protein
MQDVFKIHAKRNCRSYLLFQVKRKQNQDIIFCVFLTFL